ncbi:hypothetical protein OGATHE_000854 [Ogataea polymorpha]|uniref:Uncharacterized protein n=1 Tax=Ogataea polymorpha TaxID=460523 RepID=A0A9P8PTJ3_9ASCO|nr:hypothetical protein OGATHE_000854 [Ogataea polymorpha]
MASLYREWDREWLLSTLVSEDESSCTPDSSSLRTLRAERRLALSPSVSFLSVSAQQKKISSAPKRAASGRATPNPMARFFLLGDPSLEPEPEVVDGDATTEDIEVPLCDPLLDEELDVEVLLCELLLERTVPTPLMLNSLESSRLFMVASMVTSSLLKVSGTRPANEWLV